jgi:RNA polymerase sigma-70 factor (family 1)
LLHCYVFLKFNETSQPIPLKDPKDIHHLLERLSESNEAAFRELFHLFSDRVYSFSFKLTRSHTTAEEMVQEVFLKIWMNRRAANGIENFPGYLFITTKNLVLNAVKRKAIEEKAKALFVREAEHANHQTEETVIYRDYEQLLRNTINHLPPQQRLVYSMCHQEGLQYEEVAQRLKISKLTVKTHMKTHMQQALKTIKGRFGNIIRLGLFLILFA